MEQQTQDKQKNSKSNSKVCTIINGTFSWVLKVDGKEISFNGFDNAEYFAKLYKKLGYLILWDKVESN